MVLLMWLKDMLKSCIFGPLMGCDMVRGIVYKYTSPCGKSYIGQTTNEKLRRKLWNSSRYHYAGTKIDRARAKYTSNSFDYNILFAKEFSSKDIALIWLNIVEQYYIQLYNTVTDGYNCEYGGGGNSHHTGSITHRSGYKLSEEAKKRIGKGSRAWQNTPEGKAKMSKARKGKSKQKGYKNPSSSRSVIQLSLQGEFINEFPSIREAAKYIGKNYISTNSNISSACNGKRDSVSGFKWMFKEDYQNYYLHPEGKNIPQRIQRVFNHIAKQNKSQKIEPKEKKRRTSKYAQKIGQYNSDYKLVKIWRCAGDAANELGFCEANIRRAEKTLGTYMGYYWRVYTEQANCLPKPAKKIKKPALYKKVIQKDLHGQIVNIYDSIGQACCSMGIKNRTCLSRCLNGKTHTAYGYKWEFFKCV